MYDKVVEYWITVRESGSFEEEVEMQERHKSTSKAPKLNVYVLNCIELVNPEAHMVIISFFPGRQGRGVQARNLWRPSTESYGYAHC